MEAAIYHVIKDTFFNIHLLSEKTQESIMEKTRSECQCMIFYVLREVKKMRKLKNKVKTNFGRKLTKAAIIAAAGLGAMSVTVPAFADEMHHCSCGENHDDPNCTCGCQEAKAQVANTLKELESSQLTLKEKRELQEQLQAELEAVKKAHEEYLKELQNAIDENLKKAQEDYDEAKSILDSANATSNEAKEALEAAAAEYEAAANALKEAEEALAALEEANPGIEKEYKDDLAAVQAAQDELDQAIEDEEKALAEKEEADRQAEEARQKRENARAAREKAKADADAAGKRKAEAEETKRAADDARTEAQGKYNEADEAYSYKKGLADGTIPIESTPEWAEAQKTQEALDKATADKKKADEELKKAEDDLAEKEKALDDANADYDEKSKVCEETREALKKAKEELAAAQEENKADKKALENAKTEKENADKDVEDKTKALQNADKALDDAKKTQENAQKALEDAKKAKKEAEEALQKHKDEAFNSVAFCRWVVENSNDANLVKDAQGALDVYEEYMGESSTSKIKGRTDLTDVKDATSLDNMLESVKFLEECNALRKHEGYDPQNGGILNDLRASLRLMMISQLQLNWSDTEYEHSRAIRIGGTASGENLAWGQRNKANTDADLELTSKDYSYTEHGPFWNWYTYEKDNYIMEDALKRIRKMSELLEGGITETVRESLLEELRQIKNSPANGRIHIELDFKNGTYNGYSIDSDSFSLIKHVTEKSITDNSYWEALKEALKEPNHVHYPITSPSGDEHKVTGHYLNIVSSLFNITGFAYDQYGGGAYGHVFSGVSDSGNYPTVNEFSILLNSYADKTKSEQEKLQKVLEDAAKALEDATTTLDNAKQDVTDKTKAKSDAEDALDQAGQIQTDKTKALEDATNKEKTSAKRVSDAETALGLRTDENKQAEDDLTQSEEVKSTAEKEAKSANDAKNEKQQEADKKNGTFTEAKAADDKADGVVQDLLDGKEVPALEAVAKEAKDKLDKANADQTKAGNDLKAADDDSKAKSDDLNKKTAEEEEAVKDQEAKEKAARDKDAALNTAKNSKKTAEDKKAAADAKAADSKKRLDDVNAARDAKDAAKNKSDEAKAKKDAAQKAADDAASHVATVSTEADLTKRVLDEAKSLNAASAITSSEEECYAPFADKINKVKKAIKDEDEANVRYTEAENECVTAEADEKTKKEAYDQAVTSYSTVHEHCGHDMMEISYRCTAGDGNVWTKTSGKTSDFTFERSHEDDSAFGHFTGITVDGKAVDAKYYTAEAGSVVVKLSPEFLETLAVGEHTIKAEFDDGSAEAKFSVKAAAGSGTVTKAAASSTHQVVSAPGVTQTAKTAPATGDNGAGIWVIAAAVSAAAIAGAVVYRKRKADR